LPEGAFYMVGDMKEVQAKAKKLVEEVWTRYFGFWCRMN
jgi:hypothetical protein